MPVWITTAGSDSDSQALILPKAVIFQMEVEAVYSEYIVKLSVEGESESYYVISDEPRLDSSRSTSSMRCFLKNTKKE